MKKDNGAKFSFIGYLLFLIPIAIVEMVAVAVYQSLKIINASDLTIVLVEMVVVLVCTLIFTLIDIIRRRIMVDEPMEKILNAIDRLAKGDFSVKLVSEHSYDKYDKYDLVMENINKMASELSKSKILKTDFLSNMSHEIKTPLSVIQNYAKLLQDKDLDAETRTTYAEALYNASKRLTNLITNILKLNKLENPNFVIKKKRINVSEILRQSIIQFEEVLDEKNIELNCDIAEIKFVSNESCLEVIINNLISNAIKFTDKGGKINITLKNANDLVVLKVQDNGCGMGEDVGKHIFEKFYQGDTSHAGEGNGLGLAMVKRVIDMLGGQIEVTSKINEGSTFVVKLNRN